jgi:branched-chain amino acid aminotransferase
MTNVRDHPPVVLWFRQDLRLTDHQALSLALSTGQPILPLYILEERRTRPLGAASLWWLHESLKDLENSLTYLCLRRGKPEEIFMDGMRQLIALDQAWIPMKEDYSLYIRPFMFSTDELIGVRPSDTYKFMIILSPCGPYYAEPMRIFVEEHYVRAVPGGVGYAKAAGNYGAAMLATAEAKKKGYDQVLWMDAIEHRYVQECGTMNVFFIIGNTAITPGLEQGTILEGVTRMSVISMLKEMGVKVEERDLGIDEIVAAYNAGEHMEVFGTGTAATISPIKELGYKDLSMKFDLSKWEIAPAVKKTITDIREGRIPDTHGWMFRI